MYWVRVLTEEKALEVVGASAEIREDNGRVERCDRGIIKWAIGVECADVPGDLFQLHRDPHHPHGDRFLCRSIPVASCRTCLLLRTVFVDS